jgi:L-glyceraldehyde 3-phosphate reductase
MPELKKPAMIRPVRRNPVSSRQFSPEPTRYERMPYRQCGASGLKLPAISLGAWETFGGYRGPEVARDCIFAAFNLGINHFDLANNYGRPPGRAETVVGQIVSEMPRDELIISTKAGFHMWPGPYGQGCSRKSLLASIDQSLQRLGLGYVDIFYAHRMDPETPVEETLGALDQIVRAGKALYVGLSNYSAKLFEEAVGLAGKLRFPAITVEQSSYSLFNRRIESEFLSCTRRLGAGMVAFSPLAQGLLSEKYLKGIPDDSRAAKMWTREQRAIIGPTVVQRIVRLNEIAKKRGQTLAQMAIAWILRRPEVTSVLIGASEVGQVQENVRALENVQFADEELNAIDKLCAG